MSDEPPPLVPAEVDLRGYEFMPYYGDRLRESDMNSRSTDAEYRAAHNLWWSSWKQVPAASLPDDDVVLARLADLGRDLRTWKKLRDGALRGFVKCSDGRLYHRVLSPLAIDAWVYRQSQVTKAKKRWPARPVADPAASSLSLPGIPPGDPAAVAGGDARKGKERKGEDRKDKNGHDVLAGEDPFSLPDCVDQKVWAHFERERKKMGHPLSDYASKLIVEKLLAYRAAGDDPNACLNQSIELGYRGVFPLKDAFRKNAAGRESENSAVLEEAERRIASRERPA